VQHACKSLIACAIEHAVESEESLLHTGRESVGSHVQVINGVKGEVAAIASHSPPSGRCRDLAFDNRRTVDSTQVLIVDTDRVRCAHVAEMIHTIGGFETLFAHSGSDALILASDFLPGFVLLNTDLPQMQCYRLAKMLHQRAALCDSRLIALTSEIISMDRRAALMAGFEQFLTLPLQQDALNSVLTCRSHRGLERSRISEPRV
jgi:PleD family two-component response regulator